MALRKVAEDGDSCPCHCPRSRANNARNDVVPHWLGTVSSIMVMRLPVDRALFDVPEEGMTGDRQAANQTAGQRGRF